MPASRSNTWRLSLSEPNRSDSGNFARAFSFGTERHSQEGTSFSSTFFSTLATPALRKYFCAKMSAATCDHVAGTFMPSSLNTTEPSGLRISLVAERNSIPA